LRRCLNRFSKRLRCGRTKLGASEEFIFVHRYFVSQIDRLTVSGANPHA
jgi:hypothetical protein